MNETFKIAEYKPEFYIPRHTVETSRLFPEWSDDISPLDYDKTHFIDGTDKIDGKNFLKGKYKDIPFEFSDLYLTKRLMTINDDNDKSESNELIFHGQMLYITIPCSVPCFLGLFERKTNIFGKYSGVKHNLETENVVFNNKFLINASNDVQAFMILTPHFMEALIRMDVNNNGRTFMTFIGDKVYIGIETGRYSFKLNRDIKDPDLFARRIKSEVYVITYIIDEILNNQYLCKNYQEG